MESRRKTENWFPARQLPDSSVFPCRPQTAEGGDPPDTSNPEGRTTGVCVFTANGVKNKVCYALRQEAGSLSQNLVRAPLSQGSPVPQRTAGWTHTEHHQEYKSHIRTYRQCAGQLTLNSTRMSKGEGAREGNSGLCFSSLFTKSLHESFLKSYSFVYGFCY